MKIERFEVEGLAQYSYVISDAGEAVVIDAIRDVDRYLKYAGANGLKIVAVTETHIHADFAAGSVELAALTEADLALSGYDRGERFEYAMEHRALKNGDSIAVGGVRLEVVHTPGHTPEHVSFVLYGKEQTTPLAMFSGDFLFVGSLGRPDLLGEAAKIGLAHDLYKSVTERIAGLPDGLLVYPGHGAGSLCGSGMGEMVVTTLGYERAVNPFFRYGEGEFVEKILGSVPPMPVYYPRMKELNANGAAAVGSLPKMKALAVEEVLMLREAGAVVLDVRRMEAFGVGHVEGAVNIGLGGNLSMWAGWLVDVSRKIVLVTEEDTANDAARLALLRVGLDEVVGYLDGGMRAWAAAGFPMATLQEMSVSEVEQSGALLLDVRHASERKEGNLKGAKHVPLGELGHGLKGVAKTAKIVVACASGYRASVAGSLLQRDGFEGVSVLAGGMAAWNERMALPVVGKACEWRPS